MKDQTKDKKQVSKEMQGTSLVIDESLNKYSNSEFAPEKLKKAERKFSKQIVHN